MPLRSSTLEILTTKLHTVHPAILLASVAIASWLAVPTFAAGDTDTANTAAPIQGAADAARSALPGGKMALADAAPILGADVPAIRTAVIPSPIVGPGGSHGGAGTPALGSGSTNLTRSAEPVSRHENLHSQATAASNAPPVHSKSQAVTHPVTPPPAKIPPATTPPAVWLRPAPPPVAHPPLIAVRPFGVQGLGFGRPMGARPFMGRAGFAGHR